MWAALVFVFLTATNCAPINEEPYVNWFPYRPKENRSIALVEFIGDGGVNGQIYFYQINNDRTNVYGFVHGLSPGEHGFHIHEFGNISNNCLAAGGHYNPTNVQHGGRFDRIRHVGDLGNIIIEDDKIANVKFKDTVIELSGEQSIIGRTVVVHSRADDLGRGGDEESKKTGNAGRRVACGILKKLYNY